MTPETITILVLIAIAAAAIVVTLMRQRKPDDAPQSTTSGSDPTQPAKSVQLTAADYAESFFGGHLGAAVAYPYKLPAYAKGYGPNGEYDKNKFDPRAFDAKSERIIGPDGTYVDVRTLTRHHADGSTAQIEPMTMRQWLYGLTIDPVSVPKDDLLAQGIVTAPRAYLREHAYTGPGSFGGGA